MLEFYPTYKTKRNLTLYDAIYLNIIEPNYLHNSNHYKHNLVL